jgi:hypothetical protein
MKQVTNNFKGIRKDISNANNEYYAETLDLGKVCMYFREDTIMRPLRDIVLARIAKYVKPDMIRPGFIVANDRNVVIIEDRPVIMKRKRIETEESTEEKPKYKFVLSDVPKKYFSPSYIQNILIQYANKQFALIASGNVKNETVQSTVLDETDTLKEGAKDVVDTANAVAHNKSITADNKAQIETIQALNVEVNEEVNEVNLQLT